MKKKWYLRVLEWIIFNVIVPLEMYDNLDGIKPGSKVCYNWMAKICIPTVVASRLGSGKWMTVRNTIPSLNKKKQVTYGRFVNLYDGSDCDAVWLRSKWIWEKPEDDGQTGDNRKSTTHLRVVK